jgi:hypothetical protein
MKMTYWIFSVIVAFIAACNSETKDDNEGLQPIILPENTNQDTVEVIYNETIKERFFDNLSYTNNFKISFFERSKDKNPIEHYWTILIYDKKMNLCDSIVQPAYVFFSESVDFEKVRSYSRNHNKNDKVVDNDYGNFVVADFNFDFKNDFAIVNDIGGNGGAMYSFYVQNNQNKFVLDPFLTDSITYFPAKINSSERSLITQVHAGACYFGENKYTLDNKNKWKKMSHKEINICNDN